eukprot:gene8399-9880_t
MADIGCLSESGKPVDWWVMSKQPELTTQPEGSRFREGLGYAYADAHSPTLLLSDTWLNSTTNTALAHTLAQIYGDVKSKDHVWVMYNDQPPNNEASSTYAHSKGSLAFSSTAGFWLIHSTPRFPLDPTTDHYAFPENEIKNGQSYLCISLAASQFSSVVGRLFVNRPYIYSHNVPTTTKLPVTQLLALIGGDYENQPTGDQVTINTIGGVKLEVFAKNREWNNDLYENLVQTTLRQAMIVTSWRLGANSTIMPTFCTPTYKYDSINSVELTIGDGADQMSWKYTKDHSKWAVSLDDTSTPYLCIGDINRMFSQYKRGGGTACFNNVDLWKSYYSMIANTDSCK